MQVYSGLATSHGIAIGISRKILREPLEIKQTSITPDEITRELQRFEAGVESIILELDELIKLYSHSRDNRDILTTHKMILMDPEFLIRVRTKITKELFTTEHAIQQHFAEVVELFQKMDNEYFAQRSADYKDVSDRLLSHLLNKSSDSLDSIEAGTIIISDTISPSLLSRLIQQNIGGLCLERGTRNSHSSIIARSMNVPMIINVPQVSTEFADGQMMILDGNTGTVILHPDEATLQEYQKKLTQQQHRRDKLQEMLYESAVTSDGHPVILRSNIEIPEEMTAVLDANSDGIGLFRTEFLFMGSNHLPSEQEQYNMYRSIAEQAAPHSVTIRTIDVGGDKLSALLNLDRESNPNLGCRGIRLSFAKEEVFRVQIRAVLRANITGSIKLMFPMISGIGEFRKVKDIIVQCGAELDDRGEPWRMPDLGVMIEVPSAALTADVLAKEVAFMSIGTNDLVQYTLAVDRDNDMVEAYYQTAHPAVLRLIEHTAQQAAAHNIPVAVCGEMAGDPRYLPLLLGLGVTELSVSPSRILTLKQQIRAISYHHWKLVAKEVLSLATARDVEERITKEGSYDSLR